MRDSPSPPPPRLLLVGTFLSHVGNRSVGEDLGERLRGRGWKVTQSSSATGRVGRLADMLATAVRRRDDYDVAQVDVYGGRAFRWAEAVAGVLDLLGKPFALVLRGGTLPEFARRNPARVRRLFGRAAIVVSPSEYVAKSLRFAREDLFVLPNPVDVELFEHRPRTRLKPRIVWIRAFHSIYRPELAPEALALLSRAHPNAQLTMVGPDKDGSMARTLARARDLGVDAQVQFTGGVPHSEVPKHLARADLFLNTTDVDNTPVSVLEAMASGLPVVSTNVGGIPHLLEDNVDALLVPPGDPAAIAQAAARLLDDPALATRISVAGREKVETMSWSVTLPLWERLFRRIHAEES